MTSRSATKPATETLYQAEAHGPGMLCTTWSYNRGHGVTRATVGPLVREWMARDIGHGGHPFHMVRITCRGETMAEALRAADGEWYTTTGRIEGLRTRDEKWPETPEILRERAAFAVAMDAWRKAEGSEEERAAVLKAAYDQALAA